MLTKNGKDILYPNKWGCSAAGLVRSGEKVEFAAQRTLKRELGLNKELTSAGSSFYDFDGVRRFMFFFYTTTTAEVQPNSGDSEEAKWIKTSDVHNLIKSGSCMPTLQAAIDVMKGVMTNGIKTT